jgi:hypothetical protein
MPLARVSIALILLALGGVAAAATRTWPGPAPCASTLQACIDASAAADTVLVASNAVIDESLAINKPLLLQAAAGWSPTLAADRTITGSVGAPGTWTWRVEGFRLQRGFISLQVSAGVRANVEIRGNRVLGPASGAAPISVFKASAATAELAYDVSRNVVDFTWSVVDGALRPAVQVLDGGAGSSNGRLVDNRITAFGSRAIGILVSTSGRTHATDLLGNQIIGGREGSIRLRQGSFGGAEGGSLDALVTSNVIRSEVPGARDADGIRIELLGGMLALQALHNTVVDAAAGVDVVASSGTTASGAISGNLFAQIAGRAINRSGAPALADSANLFFQTGETPATPGLAPNSVFADPRLRAPPNDLRLRADSPAIDRVSPLGLASVLAARNLPATDGDGLRRVKTANTIFKAEPLDIGALEAGDTTFGAAAPIVAPGNTLLLDDPSLNGFAGALPQVTQNWNPDNAASGIYNDHPLSLRYLGGSTQRWQLRQEDLAPFAAGARFNLFAPGVGVGRHAHLNTVANTSGSLTTLAEPNLDNREDLIVLVVRNPGSGTVFDVVSPLAVNFFSGVWSVVRLDGLPMPASGGFNVYFQPPGINAFRHRASAGNILGNVSYIDHPLLNGSPCARFQIGQATDFGVSNNHHIGVFYAGARAQWAVFNQDFAGMPAGAQFHVLVDPARVACADGLFADGFEAP